MHTTKDTLLAEFARSLQQTHGRRSLQLGRDYAPQTAVLSTGFTELDRVLNGGIPGQRVTGLIGQRTSGRTSLAYHLIAQAQATGGIVVYLDTSHRFASEYARQVCGVMADTLLIFRPAAPLEALEVIRDLLALRGQGLIVLDWEAEFQALDGTLRRIAPLLKSSQWTLLLLTATPPMVTSLALVLQVTLHEWVWEYGDIRGYQSLVKVAKASTGTGAQVVISVRFPEGTL